MSISTSIFPSGLRFQSALGNPSPQPVQNSPVTASGGSATVSEGPLLNGARGSFVQVPTLQRSVTQVVLPLPLYPAGAGDFLTAALAEGSQEQKQRIDALKKQGIELQIYGQCSDQLVVRINTEPGQAMQGLRAALSLVLAPSFQPDTLQRIAQQGAMMLRDVGLQPEAMLSSGADKRLYGASHPLGMSPLDEAALLERFTPQALIAYHRQVIQSPQQARVTMLSPMGAPDQQLQVNQVIQSVGWYPPFIGPTASRDAASPSIRGNMGFCTVPNPATDRAWLQANWKFPSPGDPDYPASVLLCALLKGSGPASPGSFNELIRGQHGLTYGVTGQIFPEARLKDGFIGALRFDVDFANVGQAVQDINTVITRMRQIPVPPLMLDGIKRQRILDMRLKAQNENSMAAFYQPWLMFKQPLPSMAQWQGALSRVTPADIQRVADRIFNTGNGQAFQLITVSAPPQVLQRWFPGSAMAQPGYR